MNENMNGCTVSAAHGALASAALRDTLDTIAMTSAKDVRRTVKCEVPIEAL